MVDPSPQRGSSWTSRNFRKNYPNQAMLGGEVGLWSSDLNALTAPEAKEAVAEIEELGSFRVRQWMSEPEDVVQLTSFPVHRVPCRCEILPDSDNHERYQHSVDDA